MVSVRCIGERRPVGMSVKRMIVPLASGGVTSGRSVGSTGSVAAIGAGVARVDHSFWSVATSILKSDH